MLDNDVENNSVWSFRYFIKMRTADYKQQDIKALVQDEIQYVFSQRIPESWNNEAVWAYLRGMLATSKQEAE